MRSYNLPVAFLLTGLFVPGLLRADKANEVLKLVADDLSLDARFGSAVSVVGSMAAVGSAQDGDNGTNAGSAYLMDVITGDQIRKFLPADGAASDLFGSAIDYDGTTIVIGAPGDADNGTSAGSAYLFDAGTGQELFKLLPNDGAKFDSFGASVAVGGAYALVGAYLDDDNGGSSGSAYVFDTATGQQLHKIVPADGATNDLFGFSVAIGGTTAVIGAYGADANGINSGVVYLFDLATGQETGKLLAADTQATDFFGYAVDASSTHIISGTYAKFPGGAAYIFDLTTGAELSKLTSGTGAPSTFFGGSVAIGSSYAIVGASTDDDNGSGSGSIFLFDVPTGELIGKYLASDGRSGDSMGSVVAVSGAVGLAGAPANSRTFSFTGAAYVFDLTASFDSASRAQRNGSGANAIILTSQVDPVLSTTWTADLDCSGHLPAFAVLEAYSNPSAGTFLAGGELLVDLTSPLIDRQLLIHFGNVVTFSLAIPNDYALCSLPVFVQGVVLGGPRYELSNAIDLVVGL